VDAKKNEWVGDFKNAGREWQPTQTPDHVRVHDFPTQAAGKAIPYGVYDMARNERVSASVATTIRRPSPWPPFVNGGR
jgi:hypothetical protein